MARESPNGTTTQTQHACPDTVLIKPSQPAQALKASEIINTLSYTNYSNRTGTDGNLPLDEPSVPSLGTPMEGDFPVSPSHQSHVPARSLFVPQYFLFTL